MAMRPRKPSRAARAGPRSPMGRCRRPCNAPKTSIAGLKLDCRARLASMPAHPEDYFPADYRQARRNFIAACEKAGIDSIARVHPAAKGPDGKPLFIDCAAIGPRHARRALLLIAGTHGVEGYFGSEIG